MKMKYFGLFLFSCFIIVAIGYSSIPNDWYYGRRVSYSDAQSVSLAGNDLFKSNVFISNPLGKSIGKPELSFSYNLGFLLERRTQPVYDQFDNTVGEVAISENLFTNGRLGNLAVLYPLSFMNVGVKLQPQYIFDYYFYQEFRDDFYAKVGEKELKVTGTVSNASVMVGKEFAEKFGIGAGFNYYFGSRKYYYHDSILYGHHLTAETTGSPTGFGFTAGVSAMPIERLLVNLTFQSGITLDDWSTDVSRKFPNIFSLSAAYLAAGEIPTKIGVTAQYADWTVLSEYYRKTVEVGMGVEHTLFNSVALRYGFRFEPSFVPPTVHQGAVSLGWGFMIGNVIVDIGMDVKRRIITSSNLMNSDNNMLKVYENTGEIIVGARIPIQ